jgi:hypothetical protein
VHNSQDNEKAQILYSGLKNVVYIHTVEDYSFIKENEVMLFAGK